MMSSSFALRVTFIWMWMITVDRVQCAIVSWNKNVISSSTSEDWVPARIIDGNQRTDAYKCGCCAGTESESNPWYQLDLGKPYHVRKVEIKGRHNGKCGDGEYGHFCDQTCHCDGDPCNKTSGICPSGKCLAGYEGQSCDKDRSDTMYVLAISGWTFGGVVLIAAVGIGIFIWIRRRKAPTTTGTENLYDLPNRNPLEEEHPYTCSAINTQEPPYSRPAIDRQDTNPVYIYPEEPPFSRPAIDRQDKNPVYIYPEEPPFSRPAIDTQDMSPVYIYPEEPPFSRSAIDKQDTNPVYINPMHVNAVQPADDTFRLAEDNFKKAL